MTTVYYTHPSLDCLMIADSIVIDQYAVLGQHGFERSIPSRVYDSFLEFWRDSGLMNARLVYKYEPAKERRVLSMYAAPNTLDELLWVEKTFNADLFGSNDKQALIASTNRTKSKAKMARLIMTTFPDMANPRLAVVTKEDLQKIAIQKPIVVKAEYSRGGLGSAVVTSPQELARYLGTYALLPDDITRSTEFVIEEYVPPKNLPAICFFLEEDEIALVYMQDRLCDKLAYRSSKFPTASRQDALYRQGMLIAQQIHADGYRGPIDIEFIDADKLYFCEINARHPISIYPHLYGLNKNLPIWQMHMTSNEPLSFQKLDRALHTFWYDPYEKKGILPLGIPHFLDQEHTLRMCIAGYAFPGEILQEIEERLGRYITCTQQF
ncbi:MAG: hypothetical protein V1725_00410 [archaeon]